MIPPNASVLLSLCSLLRAYNSSSVSFGRITINAGSSLIFADAPLNLTTSGIVIAGGALAAGSPSCRLRSAITVTLTGSRPLPAANASLSSDAHEKGIVVEGNGTLDLHGVLFSPTWTRLGASARTNDSWIFTQEPINWDVGGTLLVTTTAVKDSRDYSESEEVVCDAVYTLPNGMGAIHLAQPLRHGHYAGREYQAEVAFLSRRLVVQGALADSPPTDAFPVLCPLPPDTGPWFTGPGLPCGNTSLTGYGGHVMVSGASATGRVAGVLLLRMGMTNYLGRYPFHLHMLGAEGGARSYLTDSAIWRSYYRCASLHGTNNASLIGNVAHDVSGYCFYLENGVEEDNLIAHNLASLVHPLFGGTGNYLPVSGPGQNQEFTQSLVASPTLVLPADATAAGFYVTNAKNDFIGNAASGGWAGFAFPSLPAPINEHRGMAGFAPPSSRPTRAFVGNSAHSSGYYWSAAGCIYIGGVLAYSAGGTGPTLVYNPGRSNANNPVPGVDIAHKLTALDDTKIFLCNGVALQHWGAQPIITNLETHDVGSRAANIFGYASLSNWLITCRTPNPSPTYANEPGSWGWLERVWLASGAIFQSYDIGQAHILNGVTFRNCTWPSRTTASVGPFTLLQLLTHSDQFTPDVMIATANVSFEDSWNASSRNLIGMTVNASTPTASQRMQNWLDADGSITGRGVPTQIGSAAGGSWWWRADERCTPAAAGSDFWACDKTPSRGAGAVFFSINDTSQSTPYLGRVACSNGNWATIPCPAIGRVWHLGHTPDVGMDLPLNARLTGPTGGFGWVVGGDAWRAPVVLNITQPQVEPGPGKDPLLVLPYPRGSRFTVTAYSASGFAYASNGQAMPSWCFVTAGVAVVASNLCSHAFSPVASVNALRRGGGDEYFFDNATGHLYLRVSVFKGDNFLGLPNVTADGRAGLGRVWGVSSAQGWSALGLSLPPRGSNSISIVTDCGGVGTDAETRAYCAARGGNGGAMPASPCAAGVPLPLAAFDACPPPSSSRTPAPTPPPSSSRTPAPTPPLSSSTMPAPTVPPSPIGAAASLVAVSPTTAFATATPSLTAAGGGSSLGGGTVAGGATSVGGSGGGIAASTVAYVTVGAVALAAALLSAGVFVLRCRVRSITAGPVNAEKARGGCWGRYSIPRSALGSGAERVAPLLVLSPLAQEGVGANTAGAALELQSLAPWPAPPKVRRPKQ